MIPFEQHVSEADQTDKCPGTPTDTEVDDAGCSQQQFCKAIDATSHHGKRVCERSDWLNDEPLRVFPRDCTVDRGGRGQSDGRCMSL